MTNKDVIIEAEDTEYIGQFDEMIMDQNVGQHGELRSQTLTVKLVGKLYEK